MDIRARIRTWVLAFLDWLRSKLGPPETEPNLSSQRLPAVREQHRVELTTFDPKQPYEVFVGRIRVYQTSDLPAAKTQRSIRRKKGFPAVLFDHGKWRG